MLFRSDMGKIISLKAGTCALNTEERSPFDIDEEMKRSLYDLIDVDETSPSFNIFRMSPIEDNIELSDFDLASNYLSSLPVAGRTLEFKSSLDFERASPTDISYAGSCSPSSVCSILRGSLKDTPSLNFNSRHRQGHGKQKQLQTQLW